MPSGPTHAAQGSLGPIGGAVHDGAPPRPRGGHRRIPGPRQEYIDAFDDDVFRAGAPGAVRDGRDGRGEGDLQPDPASARPPSAGTHHVDGDGFAGPADPDGEAAVDGEPAEEAADRRRRGLGRSFTGVAAAAVTTVLAVVVAGQVADPRRDDSRPRHERGRRAGRLRRLALRQPPREVARRPPPTTSRWRWSTRSPRTSTGPARSPRCRAATRPPAGGRSCATASTSEKGLPLDAGLFAEAVHRTLNDDRSWAHDGARGFERVSHGPADFVITLASPGTTADWCRRSGLDTTVDNVSCDAASTPRIMINAYRWAQGAKTYGAPDAPLPADAHQPRGRAPARARTTRCAPPGRPGAGDDAADEVPHHGRADLPAQRLAVPAPLRGPGPEPRAAPRRGHPGGPPGRPVPTVPPRRGARAAVRAAAAADRSRTRAVTGRARALRARRGNGRTRHFGEGHGDSPLPVGADNRPARGRPARIASSPLPGRGRLDGRSGVHACASDCLRRVVIRMRSVKSGRWCDRLVRGLPGHEFDVYALSRSAREEAAGLLGRSRPT